MALSGWLSFRNFGMPGVIGWAILRRSKHTNLLPLDHQSLTVRGPDLPSPKRLPSARLLEAWLRAGRSKVLQENHPCGPGLVSGRILIFSQHLRDYGKNLKGRVSLLVTNLLGCLQTCSSQCRHNDFFLNMFSILFQSGHSRRRGGFNEISSLSHLPQGCDNLFFCDR